MVVHQKERYHQVTVQYQVSSKLPMLVAAAVTILGAEVMALEAAVAEVAGTVKYVVVPLWTAAVHERSVQHTIRPLDLIRTQTFPGSQ